MQPIHRCFLVAEGPKNGYPNYKQNKISVVVEDPANLRLTNNFVSSPLFAFSSKGVASIPLIEDGMKISFLMVPNVYPGFAEISAFIDEVDIWFTLGLANIVIFQKMGQSSIDDKIIDVLKSSGNITAVERWEIKDSHIKKHDSIFQSVKEEAYNSSLKISKNVPLHIGFAISEFMLSIDRFLTMSRMFTPHYFPSHERTITVSSKRLIADLSFLFGDASFHPSQSIINSFDAKDEKEAATRIADPKYKEKKEEQINDRHGRLIQFNSSLSYLYSQAYSGCFPLLDHTCLIRRHSLLGIGSAISALFELVCQTEEAFAFLPFDDFNKTAYPSTNIHADYLKIFSDPSNHTREDFKDDKLAKSLFAATASLGKKRSGLKVPEGYYNRLAFYSGRLGFREYDFSATAAIQVLVESHSLDWHVINYTHEIIHNHVRTILTKNIINVPRSLRRMEYVQWIENVLRQLTLIQKGLYKKDITYKEYFTLVLVNYCINARYFGSLTRDSDPTLISKIRVKYVFPNSLQLKAMISIVYRDINEIFVHVIDFSYIYRHDIRAYVLAIWASWSTVPAVLIDLKQYVVRTLIIIALQLRGNSKARFDEAKGIFLSIIPELYKRKDAFIFEQIRLHLNTDKDEDIFFRFSNCIIVADMVSTFFVGNIETLLENEDSNVVGNISDRTSKEDEDDTNQPQIYDLEPGNFMKTEIKSKVVFLLDQVIRRVRQPEKVSGESQQEDERMSSWLLLSLSSYNKS